MYEADILSAICATMNCDICPYPCKDPKNSSMANCVHHWSELLSKISADANWKEVRYQAGKKVMKDYLTKETNW